MRAILLLFIISASCVSCKKNSSATPGQTVEIYLMKSSQRVPGKCQVDAAASVLQDTPLAKNQDILAYSGNSYTFTLSAVVIQKIKDFADGTPFAVTVDNKVIYYGIFKPMYSSSSCDHSITMDIALAGQNQVILRIGYPGFGGGGIDDQRNNPTLIATLQNQGKLN